MITISPSGAATLKFCPRKWAWRYVKGLERPGPIKAQMALGSMYHAMAAAVDNGQSASAAIMGVVADYRTSPIYLVQDSPLLDHLAIECDNRLLPGYQRMMHVGHYTEDAHTTDNDYPQRWQGLIDGPPSWHTLDLERTFTMAVGLGAQQGFILKVVPDKVIRDGEGRLWVVERKTTERDDRQWVSKWRLNAQTTAEVLAVAEHYNEPVQGVLLEQVVITRQRSTKFVERFVGEPQPLHRVMYHPHRPVPKSRFILEEGRAYFRGVVREILWRRRTGRQWEPNYNSCPTCDYNDICDGTYEYEQVLVEAPRDR